MNRRNKIIYWVVTGLLAFGMSAQGIAQVLQTKGYVDIIVHLGYPPYFLYIIGVWKLLGVIAILIPGFRLLKEWAYAGFFFVMTGAAASHLITHDAFSQAAPALILIALTVLSWYLRPPDRKLMPTADQFTDAMNPKVDFRFNEATSRPQEPGRLRTIVHNRGLTE